MADQDLNSDIIIFCPHCKEVILIEKLNCRIFRHGIFKENGQQIPPHSSKEDCDSFIENKKIYGCGKPYQVIKEGDIYKVIICDYV
jgi:hypothetical protein